MRPVSRRPIYPSLDGQGAFHSSRVPTKYRNFSDIRTYVRRPRTCVRPNITRIAPSPPADLDPRPTRLTRSITRFGTRKPVELACQQPAVDSGGRCRGRNRARRVPVELDRASTACVHGRSDAECRSCGCRSASSILGGVSSAASCVRACDKRGSASRREHTNQFRRLSRREPRVVLPSVHDRTLGTFDRTGIETAAGR